LAAADPINIARAIDRPSAITDNFPAYDFVIVVSLRHGVRG
jgi:hypothetical protein